MTIYKGFAGITWVLSMALVLCTYPNDVVAQSSKAALEKEWNRLEKEFAPMPVETKPFLEICKTEAGRMLIIKSMDTISKRDLYLQWQGEDFQRRMMVKHNVPAPDSISYQNFLLGRIAQKCESGTPWTFIEPKYFALVSATGSPRQVVNFGCSSANTGGKTSDDCDFETTIEVPHGYEACNLFYEVYMRRHGRYTINPTKFVNQGQQEYPRFRAYSFHVYGHGDQGNASKVFFSDVKIIAVREDTPANIRKQCGCTTPSVPKNHQPAVLPVAESKPKPAKPTAAPSKAKLTWKLVKDGDNSAYLRIFNTGETTGHLYHEVEVFDGDDNRWERHAYGIIDVPRGMQQIGFHKWRSQGFRLVEAKEVFP